MSRGFSTCVYSRVVRSYFKDPKTSNVIKGKHGCGMSICIAQFVLLIRSFWCWRVKVRVLLASGDPREKSHNHKASLKQWDAGLNYDTCMSGLIPL